MKQKIFFKEYNLKRKPFFDLKLAKWGRDKGAYEHSVENYQRFGLIRATNIIDLLCNYPPIRSKEEFTKIFIAFNEDGKDIGVAVLDHVSEERIPPYLAIFHLIIRPDEQGKGYGPAMVKKIIEKGDKMMGEPVSELFVSIDKANEPSRKMFEKIGFTRECDGQKYNYFSLKLKEETLEP